ncbi:tRNA methyltransferase 10 homolog A [Condylostylus longicornis]|uniref:tRNA methyltransferase 10 homolog A n=1 Tax=Condylostylus longicornis TaxID=2530218 RepID=UPI00244E2EE3|nr:tRNA methyltransferase 10 homolog A [Condylostylus longicornis]XP_055371187.1 tRNA methyltransferase 10 homolog A [Condylostylus longicornis]
METELKLTADTGDDVPNKKAKVEENQNVETFNEMKTDEDGTIEASKLSKRQIKKLRKLAEWEIKKKEKRLKEREKYRQKKLEALEKGEPRTGPSRKELKRNKAAESKNFLKVAVDLDYDDLMIDKDIGKCVKQLLRIYTINRRSLAPAKLYFTGIKKDGKIHKSLAKNDGYENWDVQWAFNKTYHEILSKNDILYLTSDSDNVLETLEKNTVYVIGGIVDHNHQKGLCMDRAQKLGLRTARLPLSEHIDMKTRTVLSTVHVFEILLKVSEGISWTKTLLEVLPMRKGAKPKEYTSSFNGDKDSDIEEFDKNDTIIQTEEN